MAIEETQTLNLFSWIFAWSCVFTHGAGYWLDYAGLSLLCLIWFVCLYFTSAVIFSALGCLRCLISLHEKLNHWFLSAVPTSGGISKLSHGLLTLKFSQSITSTITAAAPFHVLIFLQQCLPLLPARLFFFSLLCCSHKFSRFA